MIQRVGMHHHGGKREWILVAMNMEKAHWSFNSGNTPSSFRGQGQCTPCPAWNVPFPCLLFPFMWPRPQCYFPREACPDHPGKISASLTTFFPTFICVLLGPCHKFQRFFFVCDYFFPLVNYSLHEGRDSTHLVLLCSLPSPVPDTYWGAK